MWRLLLELIKDCAWDPSLFFLLHLFVASWSWQICEIQSFGSCECVFQPMDPASGQRWSWDDPKNVWKSSNSVCCWSYFWKLTFHRRAWVTAVLGNEVFHPLGHSRSVLRNCQNFAAYFVQCWFSKLEVSEAIATTWTNLFRLRRFGKNVCK